MNSGFAFAVSLILATLAAPPGQGIPWSEIREGNRAMEPYRAVRDLAEFNLVLCQA